MDTVPEEDFRDAVQIIGWMYQYYNSELKDKVFSDLKKNIKISKERIPAATQLFTPDWIVRYMVENSLGRVWLEGHPDGNLQSKWKYYLEEAEQEPQVKEKLKELRVSRRNTEPTDIKVIDPCMGSGHVLVYAFDVLVQIYESYGYSKQDAASLIVRNNIFGLDIDERAYQLAYFAIMMKARSYDSNIFNKNPKPNLHTMVETSDLDDSCLDGYGNGMPPAEKNLAYNDMKYILSSFRDAKTYGSLIKIHGLDYGRIDTFIGSRSSSLYAKDDRVKEAVAVAKVLSKKYDAVITNPPYLGSSGMDAKLSKYVKDNYSDAKSDLFACFIERCMDLTDKHSFTAMITQHAFMFLSSFEKFRHNLINTKTIVSMAHQGARGFDQIGGEVVQTAAFVVCNNCVSDYTGTYCRLVDVNGESAKESKFLSGENRFYVKQSRFDAIPGAPIAYWASQQFIDNFSRGISISSISDFTGSQNKTADNEKYLRFWWEVDYNKIGPGKKWVLYAKGGESRKWYGNIIHVVDWSDEARYFYETNKTSNLLNERYWYKEGITYNDITSGNSSFRFLPAGCIFDMSGPSILSLGDNVYYALGLLNSSAASLYYAALNPTIHLKIKDVNNLPFIMEEKWFVEVTSKIKKLVAFSTDDWNENEYSIEFLTNLLIKSGLINSSIKEYCTLLDCRIRETKTLQNIIDGIFNQIYQLDERSQLTIDLKDINVNRDVRRLISYFVGCLFGRYSLDVPGILLTNNSIDFSNYSTFNPDFDNIIPINDSEYFGDDIVVRFVEFIKAAFGEEYLEENLKYIADNLGIKYVGTARDGIRKYFLNNFYDDHVKMFQKRPIYWLFDSGKENGFKALIYMHRYTPDLIPTMRQDYLLPMLTRYVEMSKSLEGTEKINLQKKIEEIQIYDIAMEKYASEKISIDLDDGVKVNYAKFQNIENPGSKKKIDLLHPLK